MRFSDMGNTEGRCIGLGEEIKKLDLGNVEMSIHISNPTRHVW